MRWRTGWGASLSCDRSTARDWQGRISISCSIGHTGGMSKRLVDIDDQLLDEATAALGSGTMKETVNRSLEAVVLAARRRRHADRLERMEGLDLADADVMAGAWH